MIKVKYLASLAEYLNKTAEHFVWQSGATPANIWQALNPDFPMPANTLCAVDYEFANKDQLLSDGCELAFFPPVTGG